LETTFKQCFDNVLWQVINHNCILTFLKITIMKTKQFNFLIACAALLVLGCSKEGNGALNTTQSELSAVSSQANNGATQISGVGLYADAADCDYPGEGADFALNLSGDLEGCLFVFVEEYECSPSGTYREKGKEYFVGTYKGESGSFWTSYKFESKFEGCSEEGFFLGAEIFGRCQHPIVKGSGDGIFDGVTGRLDFKDDVETGTFPYRGHLK
jgi:hypothetical protein